MERTCASVLFFFGGLLLHSCVVGLATIPSNVTDQLALLAFKSEIDVAPNDILAWNWTTGTNFCNWVGVSCSTRRQRVTALRLPNMDLRGKISPYIGNLSFLVVLNLWNNSFHGNLAHELGYLYRLKGLVLDSNELEGSIPPSLSQCKALQIISLVYNNFSGGIPKELSTLPKLHTLFLGGNKLGGVFPSYLSNISTLRNLALDGNRLTGSIPSTLFNITSLEFISLMGNNLYGSLPVDICRICVGLGKISIPNNQLSGHIPSTLDKCRELRYLDLQRNRLEGNIPVELGSLPMLQYLYLGQNNLSGSIPPSFSNNSMLENLAAEYNNIHGKIPNDLGLLSNLVALSFGQNNLTGVIPEAIFNISSLQYISLSLNALSGTLPSTTGIWLPNLEELYLQSNKLGGEIPVHLSNCSKLTYLFLEVNLFTGLVPINLGNLQQLEKISLGGNQLGGEPGTELSFLTTLTNSRSLEWLTIEFNPLNGFIPSSLGNHSSLLQTFYADNCQIQGDLPEGIGYFKNLIILRLSNNNLTGKIPSTIGGLNSLQRLVLYGNMLDGLIPNELCDLGNLGDIDFYSNRLFGLIPTCLGKLSNLKNLDLSFNRLNSSIPLSIWTLQNLIFLNLSNNVLGSHIPLSLKLDVVEKLDLSSNQISGSIPDTIGAFQRLSSLNLSKNSLQGPIPQSFGSLIALEVMDLSYNNLSGVIPKSLEALKNLRQLNLSFNSFSGEIPSKGPFSNFTDQSFLENGALCGISAAFRLVPPCRRHRTTSRSDHSKQIVLKCVLPVIAALATLFAYLYLRLRTCRIRNAEVPNAVAAVPAMEYWRMISYYELVHATDSFSEANLLGVGSVGSVYKGILSDGMVVAVKVLNLQLEGAFKSFDTECLVLRTVRHRNLVKVISSCSNLDFKALILQYMPNGNLDKWLYSHNYFLNVSQRVSIMVDVALALEYLHHDQPEPVIHSDLNPNNILLDEDMVAHLGDFGIAKILAGNNSTMPTKSLGTIGYFAPEYGLEGKVSKKCDIYSYGIMLLEVLTRKKPTVEMFSAHLSLRQWVLQAFPDNLLDVVDGNLLETENELTTLIMDAMFELGLECSKEFPEERGDIKDVVIKMKNIKSQLLRNSRP